MNNCTGLYDKIEMWTCKGGYHENGRGECLHFLGLNEDPGQFELINDWETPMAGDGVKFVFNTTRPYSGNLWYDPIPFEMLKTYSTVPQIVVTVNDLPAVCHNVTCGYKYTNATGEVTEFTFDESTNKLVLVGTQLPKTLDEIYSVEFAQSLCLVDNSTVSETGLTCTLVREPTCGKVIPKLTSRLGVIPKKADLATIDVKCTI